MSIFGNSRAIWVIFQKGTLSENQRYLENGVLLGSSLRWAGTYRRHDGTVFGDVIMWHIDKKFCFLCNRLIKYLETWGVVSRFNWFSAVMLACGMYSYDDYTPPLQSCTHQTLIMLLPSTFVQSVNPHHVHTPVGQSDPSAWSMIHFGPIRLRVQVLLCECIHTHTTPLYKLVGSNVLKVIPV